MSQWGCRTAVVVCVILLVGAASGPAVGTPSASASGASPAEGEIDAPMQVASSPTANNTSATRHKNPSEADETSDLGAVEQHLAQLLASRLTESAIQLDQGEYERASQLLGDDYSQKWEQYVDVAGEVGTEQTAEQLAETQSTQRSYTSSVSEFQTTYEEYQEAKENGNETRARQLARQLIQLANQANETATQLDQSYVDLGNQTGAEFNTAQEAVDETQTNITAIEENVTEVELVQTRLSVTATSESVSFTSPTQLSGRLTTQNGTGIEDAQIMVPTAGENFTTTTTETGLFTLQYRPIRLSQTASTITVQYIPEPSSIYLGTNATQPIQIEPVNGTVTLTAASEQATFGDSITVRGALTVEERPVPNVPIEVNLGGTTLDIVETGQQGRFNLTTSLPVGVPAGTQQLQVGLSEVNRAVTASPAARQVTIEPTPTTLTANGQLVNDSTGRLRVSGALQLANGSGVSSQPVALRVNGTPITTVQTGPNGTYTGTFSLPPSSLQDRQNVTITAVFTGGGTNLATSQAQTRISVSAGLSEAPIPGLMEWLFGWVDIEEGGDLLSSITWVNRFIALPGWVQASGVFVLVLLSGLGISLYRRQQESAASVSSTEATSTPSMDTTETALESPLAAARIALREGDTDATIEVIYGQVREKLAPEVGVSSEVTHWEFFTACQAALSDTRKETVQRLTEWYEQAAYGPEDVSLSTAQEALLLAASLFESESATETGDRPITDGGNTDNDS